MASQTDIYNLALFKLAQSVGVSSTMDNSKAADVLNRLWSPIRDLVLTERVWPWAMRSEALAVDAEDPQPGWLYRYAYPNDCLTAYAVTTVGGLAQAGRLSRFADGDYLASVWGSCAFDWDTSFGEQQTTINTNVAQAYLVYATRVENTERYPPQFVNALAARLAAEAAPPMIGDVGLNSQSALMQAYNYALTNAGAHSMNESKRDEGYVTPSLAARDGVGFPGGPY